MHAGGGDLNIEFEVNVKCGKLCRNNYERHHNNTCMETIAVKTISTEIDNSLLIFYVYMYV